MLDNLVEIAKKDLQTLKELYTLNEKKYGISYTTIDTYIRWFEKDPNLKHVRFVCLNGEFSDGTFVMMNRGDAYADTLNESNGRLLRLLQLIDYSKGYLFESVRNEIRPVIKQAVQQLNLEITYDKTTLCYYLPKEEALKFDIQTPEGIELREIRDLHDLEKVNSVWPHRDSNSLVYFQRLAKYGPHIGAFKQDGTLVAWMFYYGLLSALQTDEMYYGKGYATLVTKYLAKKVAELGNDLYAGIFEENIASRKVVMKLGFKSIGKIHWMGTGKGWTPDDDKDTFSE